MEIRYCPDDRFVETIKAMDGKLVNVDGHMRWEITTTEGEKFYLRPDSAKPKDD